MFFASSEIVFFVGQKIHVIFVSFLIVSLARQCLWLASRENIVFASGFKIQIVLQMVFAKCHQALSSSFLKWYRGITTDPRVQRKADMKGGWDSCASKRQCGGCNRGALIKH